MAKIKSSVYQINPSKRMTLSNNLNLSKQTKPAYIYHAGDDDSSGSSSTNSYLASFVNDTITTNKAVPQNIKVSSAMKRAQFGKGSSFAIHNKLKSHALSSKNTIWDMRSASMLKHVSGIKPKVMERSGEIAIILIHYSFTIRVNCIRDY